MAKLGLAPGEIKALATQGFVARERRGGRIYWKLRFRVGGRQRVRYLGSDATKAAAIRAELAQGAVSLRMARQSGIRREGSLDNTLIAHEWGHYLHLRLADCAQAGRESGRDNSRAIVRKRFMAMI